MATMEVSGKVQNLFDKLELEKTILSTCTNLYQTLTSHFTSLEQSIDSKTQTLDTKIQTLDSNYQKTLEDLQHRESSISERVSSLSSLIESQKLAALAEFEKPVSGDNPLEKLRSLCRKMDSNRLLKFILETRKDSLTLRAEMGKALAECVDPPRLVLDSVKEFVDQKTAAKVSRSGMTDKRWACMMVIGGLFSPEELKVRKNVGPAFASAIMEKAEMVVREWKEKAEMGGGDGGGGEGSCGMGPAETSMFLQVIVGFGLRDKFEEELYKKLVIEFAARRDMSMLAVPIFGDKVGDIIDELVKNGKEVEAVYFACESGLTERFQPASLLKSYLRNSKKSASDILKKGNFSSAATDEATNIEMNCIKSIVKCVEELKLESQFPIEGLTKRLSILEKAKADKKKGSSASSKPSSNKRAHSSGGGGGRPPPRPSKMSKFSNPYPPQPYGRRYPISPAHPSPVSRYAGPYSYPSQSVYDPGLTAQGYGPSYGGAHVPATDPNTQQHYGVPGEGVAGAGARPVSSYGGQYASYDYTNAAAQPTYQPSYAQ